MSWSVYLLWLETSLSVYQQTIPTPFPTDVSPDSASNSRLYSPIQSAPPSTHVHSQNVKARTSPHEPPKSRFAFDLSWLWHRSPLCPSTHARWWASGHLLLSCLVSIGILTLKHKEWISERKMSYSRVTHELLSTWHLEAWCELPDILLPDWQHHGNEYGTREICVSSGTNKEQV